MCVKIYDKLKLGRRKQIVESERGLIGPAINIRRLRCLTN